MKPGTAEQVRRENRVDPRLLYLTTRQAELWREVARVHSPVRTNPEFARIYREAFALAASALPSRPIHLVGLGGGTGRKEAQLARALIDTGREVLFSAVDISADLAREAMQAVTQAGATPGEIRIADVTEPALGQHLAPHLPRLYTFFGLAPNLQPEALIPFLRAALRPGDRLLASVHLAPVRPGIDLATALREILSQYDNRETLLWLQEALSELGLARETEPPQISLGEMAGIPAILAQAPWKSRAAPPLNLFFSFRYTPDGWEKMLSQAAISHRRLALTKCVQEGIWELNS